MKRLSVLFKLLLIITAHNVQSQSNPLIILDTKKLGYMDDLKKEMEALNANDISTVDVLKDMLTSKKYGSESGVIVITTKKYILDTFYQENIQNSPLKEKIKSSEELAKIGIVNVKPAKNQIYVELAKYILTGNLDKNAMKIKSITFLNREDAIKLDPQWTLGAMDIMSE